VEGLELSRDLITSEFIEILGSLMTFETRGNTSLDSSIFGRMRMLSRSNEKFVDPDLDPNEFWFLLRDLIDLICFKDFSFFFESSVKMI
jgi:hypothetical protein